VSRRVSFFPFGASDLTCRVSLSFNSGGLELPHVRSDSSFGRPGEVQGVYVTGGVERGEEEEEGDGEDVDGDFDFAEGS